jgi:hypothetical protein
MKTRTLLIVGLVLLLAGCAVILYLALMIVGARVNAVFDGIVHDAPNASFPRMRCPLMLSSYERARAGVTLVNHTDAPLVYDVQVQVSGLLLEGEGSTVQLAPGERTSLYWIVTAPPFAVPRSEGTPHITVQAVSDADRALPGPFHAWPTSYRQICGVWVVNSPLKSGILLGLPLGSLVTGMGLCTFHILKRKQRPKEDTRTPPLRAAR